jgi:hypothetical protein
VQTRQQQQQQQVCIGSGSGESSANDAISLTLDSKDAARLVSGIDGSSSNSSTARMPPQLQSGVQRQQHRNESASTVAAVKAASVRQSA